MQSVGKCDGHLKKGEAVDGNRKARDKSGGELQMQPSEGKPKNSLSHCATA
jgi:hypothetical protein